MPTKDVNKRRNHSATWYENNREVARERNRQRRNAIKEQIASYKLAIGCQRCGYRRCSAALEAHHTGDKNGIESTVALMAKRGRAWTVIEQELQKCEILCANCHREHHSGL